MDIICTNCGEPWDVYYVRQEEPEGFDRQGSVIKSCPSCHGREIRMPRRQREHLEAVRAVGDLLGDDMDGLAATLEDFDLL